jgi:cytochrome c oxidase subunit 4
MTPGHGHVLPLRVYFAVFLALMAGTALTVWSAFRDMGGLNVTVALVIAGVKSLLVILYFMHVRYAPRLIWVFAIGAFLWLMILFGFTLSDYVTRPIVPGWGQ